MTFSEKRTWIITASDKAKCEPGPLFLDFVLDRCSKRTSPGHDDLPRRSQRVRRATGGAPPPTPGLGHGPLSK